MVTETLTGVFSVEIDLEGKCGTWQVDLSKVSAKDIQNEIQKLGYTATQITS
jgi:copper chaperone CopZ